MTFSLTPGKLGFKLGEVLVGLKSGTEDVPEAIKTDDGKAHTIPYLWNPDTLSWVVSQGNSSGALVNITDGAGIVNTKQLGTALTSSDVGLVTNSMIHGLSSAGGGTFVDVKVTPSGALTVDATLSAGTAAIGTVGPSPTAADTSGRFRTSSLLTLFDGKIYNAEDTLKWDTKGTGTATYTSQAIQMSVTSGQYLVRQGRNFCPYFSGKPQLIESTSINFQNESGLVKRIGYFSSNAVAPYDSDKDGWWIEADGSTYRLICSNNGTVTHNIPWTSWDAYSSISSYDWSKFTVSECDFLWLGGAGLRLALVINGAFKIVHTIDDHAGYQAQLIFKSPNQPVRYEIRSTSGSGSLTAICAMVATEGATANEAGQGLSIYSPARSAGTVGTIYALAGMRKVAAYRNHFVPVAEFGATTLPGGSGQVEAGVLLLMLNPTVSSALTWTANSRIETAVATSQTITNTGRILKAIPMSGGSIASQAPNAALHILGVGIDNTMSELIIGYTPLTTNQSVAGYMQALEY